MSRRKDGDEPPNDDGTGEPGYEVGFRKPPRSKRFLPGQSGNPKGRPKRKADADAILLTKPTRSALREELHRALTLADGTQLPAIQAVARKTLAKALEGSVHASRALLQYGVLIENDVVRERAERISQAWDIKLLAQKALFDWMAAGKPESEAPLHPDDIQIDEETGEVSIIGPAFLDRAGSLRKLIAARDEAQATVLRGVEIEREGTGDILTEFGRWFAEKKYDLIDGRLPRRFRRELKGRLPRGTPRPAFAEGYDVEGEFRRLVDG